ncbi:MAG: ABC transporter substrate-binding protein [Anaerolineae bacterium]
MWVAGLSACEQPIGGLDRVQAAGRLRVAIDPSFPPFEFVDADGAIAGLDADLAMLIAQRLGVEAHLVTTGYDALYDALTVGHADVIISALYPDPSHSEEFAFSRPYFNAGQVLITRDEVDIQELSDLAGNQVACVFGTEGHMTALKWEQSLDPPPSLLTVEDPVSLTTSLENGAASAAILDHVSALMLAQQDSQLRVVMPPVTDEPYVVAARSEDAALLAAIDEILEDLETDGTLTALRRRWIRPEH